MYDVLILGAGASGLMAASQLQSFKVCIVDSNTKIGEKIKISGGGKCNITNEYLDESYYLGDKDFIKETLATFSNKDLLKFLSSNNVKPKINPKIVKGTYFCNSSSEVLNMFSSLMSYCTLKLNTKVSDISYDEHYKIKTNKGILQAKKLIIASGGLSYTSLGASDVGFECAKFFGHSINKLNPALVGFTVQKDQFWFKELSGLSVDAKITISNKNQDIKILEGKLLFTHKGCSGPVILSTSLYWQKGNFTIDFLPYKDSYLPKRVRAAIKANEIDVHNYTMSPAGNFGYTKAEVTKGGVLTNELTSSFQSKLQKDLYFIGEVVDVTGELGGYNFQWAFSSAICCTNEIKGI